MPKDAQAELEFALGRLADLAEEITLADAVRLFVRYSIDKVDGANCPPDNSRWRHALNAVVEAMVDAHFTSKIADMTVQPIVQRELSAMVKNLFDQVNRNTR